MALLSQITSAERFTASMKIFPTACMKLRAADTDQLKEELIPKQPEKCKEEDFYQPFADWLVNEMEECTKAIVLGGNRFRDKWGTPDVIGKRESKRSDIIQ